MSIALVLFFLCLVLLGAVTGKPVGYVVIGLSVLGLLLHLFGGPRFG